MIAQIVVLVALASAIPSAEPDYLGDWRQACGDPLEWSDLQVSGPSGRVTSISDSRTLTIADDRRVRFRLAGVVVPSRTRSRVHVRRFLEERLLGRQVETLLYKTEQRGTKAGVLHISGRDIGLEMVIAGMVQYEQSDFLTAYENCLYREGERSAREELRGIWAK
jgi:endonuclease YncB( thermonuclease family)